MTKIRKGGRVVSQTNSSTRGNSQSKGKLTLDLVKKKHFMAPEVDFESPTEEMHWMASAAYNQSK